MNKLIYLLLLTTLIGCQKPVKSEEKKTIDPFIEQEQKLNKILYNKEYERGLKQLELIIFQMEEQRRTVPYRLHLLHGELLYTHLKQATEAQKVFEKLRKQYPEKIELYNYLIEISRLNENRGIEPLIQKRLKLKFDETLLFEYLHILRRKQRYDEAFKILEQYHKKSTRERYHHLKLELLIDLKQEVAIQNYFIELLKIYPSGKVRDQILLKRGFHFEQQKRYRDALKAVEEIKLPELLPLRDQKIKFYQQKLKFLKK